MFKLWTHDKHRAEIHTFDTFVASFQVRLEVLCAGLSHRVESPNQKGAVGLTRAVGFKSCGDISVTVNCISCGDAPSNSHAAVTRLQNDDDLIISTSGHKLFIGAVFFACCKMENRETSIKLFQTYKPHTAKTTSSIQAAACDRKKTTTGMDEHPALENLRGEDLGSVTKNSLPWSYFQEKAEYIVLALDWGRFQTPNQLLNHFKISSRVRWVQMTAENPCDLSQSLDII